MVSEISIGRLRSLFRYDSTAGRIFWRERDRNLTGVEAGGVDARNGYRRIRIGKRLVLAHRIAVAMSTGQWPDEVDHINGDRDDNRLCNLRKVTRAENMGNKSRYRNNKSGCAGVYWHAQHGKWCAAIQRNGKRRTVGLYLDLNEAIRARRLAEKELGFHENHGRN